jgi:hypothetical protein
VHRSPLVTRSTTPHSQIAVASSPQRSLKVLFDLVEQLQ